MSNDKNNQFHGEILTPEIARKAIFELGKVNRVAPEVGIFDAPIRCFKINQEWWALVGGMVHLLADVTAWQDAEDESYSPILEILRFMQGVECGENEPMLRQKPTDSCVMQQSLDGGETWTDIFDFSLCLNPKFTTVTDQLLVLETQNIINSGYSPTQTTITGENGAYTEEQLAEVSIQADVCNTAGKDAIYGAIDRLVRYIHTKNEDFLQYVTQVANISQQIDRAVSATPVLGLLPADELAGYIGFIVDELSQEYNATVDEDLLQETICDLFCIAVNSNCMLSLSDISDFFSNRVSPTFSNVSATFLNLVQFGLTGTFSGNDYFYFMCYFQLQIAMTKQRFLDIQSADAYQMQAQAGFNSPDNDWSIFCTACPQQYREYIWDFAAQGQGDSYLDTASDATPPGQFVAGVGWKGTPDPSNPRLRIAIPFHQSWRIRAIAYNLDWTFATHGGARNLQLRPIKKSTVGQNTPNLGNGLGDYNACVDGSSSLNWNEIAIDAFVNNAGGHVILNRIRIIFDADEAKPGATITLDNTTCD